MPINLPYTITPEMEAYATRAFKRQIPIPIYQGSTYTNFPVELPIDRSDILDRIPIR